MAEFLISKQDAGSPTGWRPVTVVTANVPTNLDEQREIAKQGWVGPGRYKLVRWDNGREYEGKPSPPDLSDLS